MGQAIGLVSALSRCECTCCESLYKYVLNDCRSSCNMCGLISVEMETDAISIQSDGSEEELEVEGCVKWHKK